MERYVAFKYSRALNRTEANTLNLFFLSLKVNGKCKWNKFHSYKYPEFKVIAF